MIKHFAVAPFENDGVFSHSFPHLFHKYLLSTHCMTDTGIGVGERVGNMPNRVHAMVGRGL